MPAIIHRLNMPLILYVFALFLTAIPAYAAAISNLTDTPQEIIFEGRAISIPAGQSWRAVGQAKLVFRGREVSIEEGEEFSLWPGGEFGPQRRLQLNSVHSFR